MLLLLALVSQPLLVNLCWLGPAQGRPLRLALAQVLLMVLLLLLHTLLVLIPKQQAEPQQGRWVQVMRTVSWQGWKGEVGRVF